MRGAILGLVLSIVSCNQDKGPIGHSDGGQEAARGPRLTWQDAPHTDEPIAGLVQAAAMQAATARKRVVVYVGSETCEPCEWFHRAAKDGSLDSELADVYLLAFDLDRDGPRLKAAGYSSRYVPLFALPDANGRASGKFIEGSIRGPGAVADITPRLRRLVGP